VKTIYSNNLWFVTIVIFFLVAFSVGSVLFMELNEREREIGTLRTFGANPLHIHKMVFYETFVMSLIAWVFGVGLSNAIGYFVNALGGIYLPPPPTVSKGFYIFFTTEPKSIVNSLIVVLLSSVIVGQILSFYFSRKEIVLQIMPRR
jgi:ABC-type antimicrobial peptide transport system permease subunit